MAINPRGQSRAKPSIIQAATAQDDDEETRSERFYMRLKPSQLREWKAAADSLGISVARLITRAVTKYLSESGFRK